MLNFGLSLLISVTVYLLLLSVIVVLKHFIKKVSFKEYISFDNICRASLYALLILVFLLVVHLSFSNVTFWPIVWLSLFTALAVIFIPFSSLVGKIKNKEFKKISIPKSIGFLGSIVFLFLEVLVFSNVGIKKEENAINVPLDSALIVETSGSFKEPYIEFDHQRGTIVFNNEELKAENIYLDFSSPVETKLQIDIMSSNDGETFHFEKAYAFDPNADRFEYFDVSKYQNNKFIKLFVVIDETNLHSVKDISPIRLNKIVVNKAFPYTFNGVRYLLLTGLLAGFMLIFEKGMSIKQSEMSSVTILKRVVLIACGLGFIYLLINSFIFASSHYILVSTIDGKNPNIYYQLFDALKKGQVYLDVEPVARLQALENPYEPSNRGTIWYLWDRAYYQGKYYCYYGIAPALLVMFPTYLFSGFKYTASVLLMQEIGTLFSIMAFCLLILELVKLLFKKINMPVLIFTLIGGVFTSLLLTNTIYKVGAYTEGIYRVPYSYGLLFLFLTLYFLLMAYQNQKGRIVYLSLVGLSAVLLVMSRPTLIFGLLLMIPLFIKILLEKYPFKKKIIDLLPMAGIVIAGAIFVMIYNYVRFDSVFEFGQSYQLTVTDNTKLAYSTKGLLPTFCNFYILPPSIASTETFPFISYGFNDFTTRYHIYNSGGIGLLFFPLLWPTIALPFLFDKKDDIYLKIMLIALPFVVFVLAFTTYCFAGYCPRYVVEMTAISAVAAVIATLKLFERLYEKNQLLSLVSLALILLSSSFISINLYFYGFDGWRESDHHSLLELIRSIFNYYNA